MRDNLTKFDAIGVSCSEATGIKKQQTLRSAIVSFSNDFCSTRTLTCHLYIVYGVQKRSDGHQSVIYDQRKLKLKKFRKMNSVEKL